MNFDDWNALLSPVYVEEVDRPAPPVRSQAPRYGLAHSGGCAPCRAASDLQPRYGAEAWTPEEVHPFRDAFLIGSGVAAGVVTVGLAVSVLRYAFR